MGLQNSTSSPVLPGTSTKVMSSSSSEVLDSLESWIGEMEAGDLWPTSTTNNQTRNKVLHQSHIGDLQNLPNVTIATR